MLPKWVSAKLGRSTRLLRCFCTQFSFFAEKIGEHRLSMNDAKTHVQIKSGIGMWKCALPCRGKISYTNVAQSEPYRGLRKVFHCVSLNIPCNIREIGLRKTMHAVFPSVWKNPACKSNRALECGNAPSPAAAKSPTQMWRKASDIAVYLKRFTISAAGNICGGEAGFRVGKMDIGKVPQPFDSSIWTFSPGYTWGYPFPY